MKTCTVNREVFLGEDGRTRVRGRIASDGLSVANACRLIGPPEPGFRRRLEPDAGGVSWVDEEVC